MIRNGECGKKKRVKKRRRKCEDSRREREKEL
jgi:hypothetical protein